MFKRCLPALFALLLSSALGLSLEVGDVVAARWSDGHYYLGTVTRTGPAACGIHFADGDKGIVSRTEIYPVVAHISVGQPVLACWRGTRMYRGRVLNEGPRTYTIGWVDGSRPSEVAKSKVAWVGFGQ